MSNTCTCCSAVFRCNHPRYFSTFYAFWYHDGSDPRFTLSFLVMIASINLIPWFIYVNKCSYVRRTVGRLRWFS